VHASQDNDDPEVSQELEQGLLHTLARQLLSSLKAQQRRGLLQQPETECLTSLVRMLTANSAGQMPAVQR
jgi:hypothetical protein